MNVVSIGGGPAGLYTAILLKKARPDATIDVYDRHRPEKTFGFGVVFSDATLGKLLSADDPTHDEILAHFAHWDDVDVHFGGRVLRSGGHGFAGMSRRTLLEILARRCEQLGVGLHFETEVVDLEAFADADLVLGADGVNSMIRQRYQDHFQPEIDWRPNRFVWLGTTRSFPAFTFFFRFDQHGLWRVHAYQYEEGHSTFIVETTEQAWRRAGMDAASEADTIAYCERLFAEELQGHRLIGNMSIWRSFPTIRVRHWSHANMVLMGDAVHTAHFSIGSGTKLAMEDAIALVDALVTHDDIPLALQAYEDSRRREVESLQRAAQVSLQWFEDTERYMKLPPEQFAFSLLTRSLRISHENLRLRDPDFVRGTDRWFAEQAFAAAGEEGPVVTPPPMFTPLRLRDLRLENRIVVSPMCQYRAKEGVVNDWHLVHLGSRAIGGAGLVICEATNVEAGGRITPGCAGLYDDEHVVAWRRVTDFVHGESGAAIGVQLGHAGCKGAARVPWEGGGPLAEPWPLVAASAIPYAPGWQVPRALDEAGMDGLVAAFVAATTRADRAGFDLIELHMAHGYLLASFLSPLTNRRSDGFGGGVEGRLRFPLRVLAAVRAAWPEHKPISVRISATDWVEGGTSPGDSVAIAQALREHGCDIVDVSAGGTVPFQQPVYGRQFQTPFSDRIRNETGVCTMTVGNISTFEDANAIVAAGRADLVLLARAHLFDPYWTRHAAVELGLELDWPQPYKSMERYSPRPAR